MILRRATLALLFLASSSGAVCGQQRTYNWSAELVGVSYHTGDDTNCPIGVGFGADIERHRVGSMFLSIAGGVRLADALACTSKGAARQVGDRWLDEAAHLSLALVPVLALVLGPDAYAVRWPVVPRIRLGVLAAKIDAPHDERHLMLVTQAELRLKLRRLGVLGRAGAIRAPLLLQSADSGEWKTVGREWHWRPLLETGLRFYW